MRASRLALVLVVAAGCKSVGPTETLSCQPMCPEGSHCEASGCVVDVVVTPPPDMTASEPGCHPACGGTTPVCNAQGNCVGCALDAECPAGQVCHVSSATQAFCVPGCQDDARCRAGGAPATMTCCGGQCIDVGTDPSNCGMCAQECIATHGAATCSDGVCVSGACAPGWADCDQEPGDGCEVNVHVDPRNCGGCGRACSLSHAVTGCSQSCYVAACLFGWDDCDGLGDNGCETSVLSSLKSCGACGKVCGGLPNALPVCVNGSCRIESCSKGFGDCNGNSGDGCETPLVANAANCGACGNQCGQGLICVGGSCTCPQCNNLFPHAAAKCINLQCIFDGCNPGFADCDNNVQDGCEVDVSGDVKNCGGCGVVCPQNKPVCINNACTNIDLNGVFNQYQSEGRNVYIWKTGKCVDLPQFADFCTKRGLAWFTPRSAQDAQSLITNAFNLDNFHTWIEIYGLKTQVGKQAMMGGFPVIVDDPGCTDPSPGGDQFGAIRKWGCSICNPPTSGGAGNQSCCWDKDHAYDWFVCED